MTYSSPYSCPNCPLSPTKPACLVMGERWALPVQIVIHPHHRAVAQLTTAPVIPVGGVTTAVAAIASSPWWGVA